MQSGGMPVLWVDENGCRWKMVLNIADGTPVIQSIQYMRADTWVLLAADLRPDYEIVTGIRKPDPKHGRNYEARWNTYSDLPMERTSEVANNIAYFHSTHLTVRKHGIRTEAVFNGVEMGSFLGYYRITVFDGSNLIRTEVVASTNEPSLCYLYKGGLRGFDSGEIEFINTHREKQTVQVDFGPCDARKTIYSRGRNACIRLENGSVGVFPPPHAFFFPRQVESVVGFLYYRRHTDGLGIGVQHSAHHDYDTHDEMVNKSAWACYNAPPNTQQRMGVYFYVSALDCGACRDGLMAYTHSDTYKALDGYKVMANHFHMSFSTIWKRDREREQDWIKLFKDAKIDIAVLNDFHDDGHQWDNTDIRLEEMHTYFEACRAFSNDRFLIIPGEEPNCGIGGHWNLFTAYPAYYAKSRAKQQPFMESTEYGPYYRMANMQDVVAFLEKTDGLLLTPHPYTKANEDYPSQYLDSELFRSGRYFGIGFRYMPADLSLERLGDGRNFDTLDDINNRASNAKYIMGEVDTYIKHLDYDLYGDFNVNYVKLDTIPTVDDRSVLMDTLRAGDFFVTTGEILIHNYRVEGDMVTVALEWTFPMEFAEIVCGDGRNIYHTRTDMRGYAPFSSTELTFAVPDGMKWVRFTAWDCAVNGAFTQPVFLAGPHT